MTNLLLIGLGVLAVGGGAYYVATRKPSAGAPVAAPAPAPAQAQNVGYQGATGEQTVYGMLGKVVEAAGTVAGSYVGSGFNSGTREGGTYGSQGDFYNWEW